VSPDGALLWKPNPGPQTRFLACTADEALYGGAAGGGKTDALLVCPTRWMGHSQFRALILRRTFPELKKSVFDRAREIYQGFDPRAHFNENDKEWKFSTGAKLYFGHAEHEESVLQYQGSAFGFIGFEELCHFTRKQYLYLGTRARSAHGLPVRIRATANPGGEGHDWVLERWAPWLDRRPDYTGPRAASGEVLWFLPGHTPDEPERFLAGGRAEALALIAAWDAMPDDEKAATPRPRSRTFIAAKLSDNPALMRNDPGYADRIRQQDAVTRRQLLDGDWLARPAAGAYFQRGWFKVIDVAPASFVARIRRWDLAATAPGEGADPDWTVGVRMMRLADGSFVIDNVVRMRASPGDVEKAVLETAKLDGAATDIEIPQDPGQAGKAQAAAFSKLLSGYSIHSAPETGDKVTRAKPYSAQVEAGNVALVRAPWNAAFVQEHEAFPEDGHDDQVDAAAGAFNKIHDTSASDFIAAMRAAREKRTA
jgi:predicted phage terminase large subunit-like protein